MFYYKSFLQFSCFHSSLFFCSTKTTSWKSVEKNFHPPSLSSSCVKERRRGKSTRSRRRTRRFAVMTEGIHLDQDETQSPGHHFALVFESMQDLFEKMSLLKYSHDFCTEYKCKPIHRYSDLSSRHIFSLILPDDHLQVFLSIESFLFDAIPDAAPLFLHSLSSSSQTSCRL